MTVFGLQAQIPHTIEKIKFDYEIEDALNFAIDNDGNFYIYSRNESTILKFDNEGKLIRKIGSRGRGPEEFLDVSLLLYNKDTDLLYAYDMPSFSVKEMTTDGEFLNQYDYPDKQMVNPFYGYIENGLAYLVFYGPYALSQDIIHITDIKKSKTLRSFFDYKRMTENKDEIFSYDFSAPSNGLHSTKLKNGDIMLMSTTYSGEFYIKNIDENIDENIEIYKIPNRDDEKSYKEIVNPNPKNKYKIYRDTSTEIYRYVVGIAEIDSTILIFEQSNFDHLSLGYHRFNSHNYDYLGFEVINGPKLNKKDDYINAFPQLYLMGVKNKSIFFGNIPRVNKNFSILKLEF